MIIVDNVNMELEKSHPWAIGANSKVERRVRDNVAIIR